MRNESRQSYNEFLGRVAQLNGVNTGDTDKAFAVAPSVQQKLENAMQESSEFLNRINIIPVDEMQGEKLGLSLSGPIASRTNTADKDRQTRDLTAINARGYHCQQTNYDSHLKYALIDAWAKFPDFQVRVARMLAQRQALDRMCIGFNGTSIEPDTNLATNPLLQDVNKGWLQKMREESPESVMHEGKVAGKVVIGAAGDFKNLDAVVFDAKQMLDPWHRNNPMQLATMAAVPSIAGFFIITGCVLVVCSIPGPWIVAGVFLWLKRSEGQTITEMADQLRGDIAGHSAAGSKGDSE